MLLLALGAGTIAIADGHAATRTGSLTLSLTVVASCAINTRPVLSAAEYERLFLAGGPIRNVSVRCSQAVPFALQVQSLTAGGQVQAGPFPFSRRYNRAITLVPGYAPDINTPRLLDLVSPDSPLSILDTPSQQMILAPDSEPGRGMSQPAEDPPPRQPMLVITF